MMSTWGKILAMSISVIVLFTTIVLGIGFYQYNEEYDAHAEYILNTNQAICEHNRLFFSTRDSLITYWKSNIAEKKGNTLSLNSEHRCHGKKQSFRLAKCGIVCYHNFGENPLKEEACYRKCAKAQYDSCVQSKISHRGSRWVVSSLSKRDSIRMMVEWEVGELDKMDLWPQKPLPVPEKESFYDFCRGYNSFSDRLSAVCEISLLCLLYLVCTFFNGLGNRETLVIRILLLIAIFCCPLLFFF